MPCILYIETATNVCSVAVASDKEILYEREETTGPSHAVLLGVFVNDALAAMRQMGMQLDAIAVSSGPGSYTGLRIGVSEAKGLCYGLSIPLIAINTLHIMATGVLAKGGVKAGMILCPMIDARRMDVYDILLDTIMQELRPTVADTIAEHSFSDVLAEREIAFFGNGAAKCKEWIKSKNAIFIEDIYPRAVDMIPLALQAFAKANFVDTAYFEPFYLKEFVATTPKNKIAGLQ